MVVLVGLNTNSLRVLISDTILSQTHILCCGRNVCRVTASVVVHKVTPKAQSPNNNAMAVVASVSVQRDYLVAKAQRGRSNGVCWGSVE